MNRKGICIFVHVCFGNVKIVLETLEVLFVLRWTHRLYAPPLRLVEPSINSLPKLPGLRRCRSPRITCHEVWPVCTCFCHRTLPSQLQPLVVIRCRLDHRTTVNEGASAGSPSDLVDARESDMPWSGRCCPVLRWWVVDPLWQHSGSGTGGGEQSGDGG